MGALFREHPVHAVSSICMSHVHAPSKMLLSCVPKYNTILLCGMYILILLFSMQIPGSRTTRPKVKECIRSGDQEATSLTSFLIG